KALVAVRGRACARARRDEEDRQRQREDERKQTGSDEGQTPRFACHGSQSSPARHTHESSCAGRAHEARLLNCEVAARAPDPKRDDGGERAEHVETEPAEAAATYAQARGEEDSEE